MYLLKTWFLFVNSEGPESLPLLHSNFRIKVINHKKANRSQGYCKMQQQTSSLWSEVSVGLAQLPVHLIDGHPHRHSCFSDFSHAQGAGQIHKIYCIKVDWQTFKIVLTLRVEISAFQNFYQQPGRVDKNLINETLRVFTFVCISAFYNSISTYYFDYMRNIQLPSWEYFPKCGKGLSMT